MTMKIISTALVCAYMFMLTGCATILNDDHKMVSFSSEPAEATVMVDGVAMGKTPCVIPVPRKGGDKFITYELMGYKTLIVKLDNKIGGEGFGNIIFGGFIGAGIDAATGRAGTYQDSLHVVLERGSGTVSIDSQDLKESREDVKSQYEQAQTSRDTSNSSTETDVSDYSQETQDWLLNKKE